MPDMGNISLIHHWVTKVTANRRTLEHQLYQIHLWHSYRSVTYFGWGQFFPSENGTTNVNSLQSCHTAPVKRWNFQNAPKIQNFAVFCTVDSTPPPPHSILPFYFLGALKKLLQKCPDITDETVPGMFCWNPLLNPKLWLDWLKTCKTWVICPAQGRNELRAYPWSGFCCECLGTEDSQHKERKAIWGQLQHLLNRKNRNICGFSKEVLTAPGCWHWLEQWRS